MKDETMKGETPDGMRRQGFLIQPGDLDVEVELELCWVWTKSNVIDLFLTLESNPSIDEVLCKDATLS